MEDKLFELMTKMYSDITVRLDSMDKKLDGKADKSDIVRIENKLDAASIIRILNFDIEVLHIIVAPPKIILQLLN